MQASQRISANPRVALLTLPFFSARVPSIQLGLLAAVCRREGFQVDPHHLNVNFAAKVTADAYETLGELRGHVTGEWLFAPAAFGDDVPASEKAYLDAFPDERDRLQRLGLDLRRLQELRCAVVPEFLRDCMESWDWGQYDVIGFSSTFQQNVASIALSRRIKDRYPHVVVVFGGANMEDEMGPEVLRSFEHVDYVISGEGEETLPALLKALVVGRDASAIPGVTSRGSRGAKSLAPSPPLRNLDALPLPDFDDYFKRVADLQLNEVESYGKILPFESSRGCWWGEKHHCTFCGLNGGTMQFRTKHPDKVFEEIEYQAERYGVDFFSATDNILGHREGPALFDKTARSSRDFKFFYEVKANLSRDQIHALHRGGLRAVQPGIESLSTHVLALMQKGSTMLQNILALKWFCYYRIQVRWNLIWGFPGEEVADYERELEVLRLIPHLDPPGSVSRIWLERFSPYFDRRDEFPIHAVRPERSYSFVYPAGVNLERIAYFFDYDMADIPPASIHQATREWVSEWTDRWNSPRRDSLSYRRAGPRILINDKRGPEPHGFHSLSGPNATAYEFISDQIRSLPRVAAHVGAKHGLDVSEEDMRESLDRFCADGLAVSENGKYLALALPQAR